MSIVNKIFKPDSIEALDNIIRSSDARLTYIAGATDLLVQNKNDSDLNYLVDLSKVNSLSDMIQADNDGLLIGAAVPMSDLIKNPEIEKKFPMLKRACQQIGSVQIQNRATLGGNIANASPAGDTLPVLAVYNAEIWIGPGQNSNFYKRGIEEVIVGPGESCLERGQYIAYIYLPYLQSDEVFWYFRKVGQRYAMAISKVSLAVICTFDDDIISEIRISTGSVSPDIKRAAQTEKILTGNKINEDIINQAVESLESEIAPITDIRSTRSYRKYVCGNLLMEALNQASLYCK